MCCFCRCCFWCCFVCVVSDVVFAGVVYDVVFVGVVSGVVFVGVVSHVVFAGHWTGFNTLVLGEIEHAVARPYKAVCKRLCSGETLQCHVACVLLSFLAQRVPLHVV